MRRKGIALKTFLFTSILITLVVAVSFTILYFVLPDYYEYTKSNRLKDNSDRLAQNLNAAESAAACAELIADFSSANNAEVISFDRNETVILDMSSPFIHMEGNMLNYSVQIKLTDKVDETEYPSESPKIFYSVGRSVRHLSSIMLTRPVHNGIIDSITISSTLQPIGEAMDVVISLIPFLLLIDAVVTLVAAYFYAKRLTRPIIAISAAAAEMQKMTPRAASNIDTNDELGELSRNLDSMYENLCSNMENLQHEMIRVEQLERSKTDFMRAASHELKTPIAALNGITEGMIDNVGIYKNKEKYLTESKRLIDQMALLVNEILSASRLESIEDAVMIELVEIRDVLEEAFARQHILIAEKDLAVSVEAFDFLYETDRRILVNTLSNIISNAFKYTKQNGEVDITMAASENGATLSVENECEPVPEEELPKLFEPFYTLNYSRHRDKSGTGLGLYIVKRNLENLQIPYEMKNTDKGVRFTLWLARQCERTN